MRVKYQILRLIFAPVIVICGQPQISEHQRGKNQAGNEEFDSGI